MKNLSKLMAVAMCVAVLGCGNDDPNKNLKPLDPNMPVMKNSGADKGGAAADKLQMPAK